MLLLALAVFWAGCGGTPLPLYHSSLSSAPSPVVQALGGPPDPAQVEAASEVKSRYEDVLLQVPGVVGVGVGLASDSREVEVVIQVYVVALDDEVRQAVPSELEGVRVEIVETGEFRPLTPAY